MRFGRSVTVTVKDAATGTSFSFRTRVALPREALLFDVQRGALELTLMKCFRPEHREKFLKGRKASIKEVD